MADFISYYFKGLYLFLTDSNFRTFTRLFFFYIGKKRYTNYTVSFNKFKISVVDMKSFIWQYQEIFMNQCYDFNTKSAKPVIYDCGANIGTSVLFFAQKHPNSIIKAFEPSPSVFEILKSNINKNNIKNVELYQNAVWMKDEELQFNDEGADNGSIQSLSTGKTVNVQALDFLEIINKEDKIDLIKIDIEGAENVLLPHIKSAFPKIEKIFIEYHSFPNEEQKLGELLLLLTQNNFRFYIRNERNRKIPFINLAKDKQMDMQLNIFAYKD